MSTGRTSLRERAADGPGEDVHPRMRARRAAVVRDAGRRRLRRIKVALAVVAVAVWVQVALQSSLLDVDEVQVGGADRTTEAEVRAAAAVDRGDAMVSLDLDGVEERVSALPWVAEARVTRSWPGTLRIVVTERRAVAVAVRGDGWALVDRTGRVLAVEEDRPAGLVEVEVDGGGAPGSTLPADADGLVELVTRIPASARVAVDRAGEGDDGLYLFLEDETALWVGDDGDVEAKVSAALAVHDQLYEPGEGCVIDVRVPSAPVLTAESRCA